MYQRGPDIPPMTDIFKNAPTVVEWIVQFNILGSTFIPRIFMDKDWANLFGNFKDMIDELVKEIYSYARFTGVKLESSNMCENTRALKLRLG